MQFTAQQIADFLKGTIVGDPNISVGTFAKIEDGKAEALSFLSNPKYEHYIYTTQSSIVLVNNSFEPTKSISATLIRVPDAYQALAMLMQLVESMKPKKTGIHELAFISKSAKIGKNAYIAPYAFIGENSIIGDNVQIYPHTFIGENVQIGDNNLFYSGVKIYDGCIIGNECIVHAGAVIGSDGFGFAPNEDGPYSKIPQIGNVVIEDLVEIGANTAIDRATMGSTIIRRGVKLDNFIQIAHNVEVGKNTVIAAHSGIAGSAKIGENCVFAGRVGVVGHISIADKTTLASYCCPNSSIKTPGMVFQGVPALPITQFQRITISSKKLPDLFQHTLPEVQNTIAELKKEIEELKNRLKE